jgi:hypothetical protein
LTDERCRQALVVIERCADGQGSWRELEAALAGVEAVEVATTGRSRAAARAIAAAWHTAEHARSAAAQVAPDPTVERTHQADLLRDIIGNPFRAVPMELSWLRWNDGCVERLARSTDAQGRYGDLPVLADALEEAGCVNEALLGHCRSRAAHTRGCWALDTLLGVPIVGDLRERATRAVTIEQPVEYQGRYVRQTSCPGHFAVVTLRLEPYAGRAPVVFLNAAEADANVQQWVPSVEEGIQQFVAERSERGQRLTGLRVVLTRLVQHSIDSRARSFERATILVLSEAFGPTDVARTTIGETGTV